MQANEMFPLESLRERLSKAVRIRLNGGCTRQKLEALWDLLPANQGDRPVAIELEVLKTRRPQESARQRRRHAADSRQASEQLLAPSSSSAARRIGDAAMTSPPERVRRGLPSLLRD